MTIYRQSEATTIKEIKVEIVDASGNVLNTYTAYQKNPSDTQNYEVVIPIKDVANINIITTPMTGDVAKVTYTPDGLLKCR